MFPWLAQVGGVPWLTEVDGVQVPGGDRVEDRGSPNPHVSRAPREFWPLSAKRSLKWEICPGTPKHVRSSTASAAPLPAYSTATVSKVAVSPKLTPPPVMSPSPYHSPRVSYYSSATASAARSASVSPSRRRPPHQHRPTAFLDVNPRVAPAYRYRAAGAAEDDDEEAGVAPPATAASRCFPLPVFRRRGGRKGGRPSTGTVTTSGSSLSASSFWSDYGAAPAPGGLRRSVSTSSSSCLSLSSRSSGKLAEAREVEAAGGWFY